MYNSWHVQDGDEDEAGAALNVDWRAYAQTHTLTDRQRKLADNIKKRENRIAALQREVDKIRVRTSMLGFALTIERSAMLQLRWLYASNRQSLCSADGSVG